MQHIQTHYDNLKVARDAPPEVIRAAYRVLSQKYHPDRNQGDPGAARAMQIINAAYTALSDPATRRAHDNWIASFDLKGRAGSAMNRETGGQPAPEPPKSTSSNASQFRPPSGGVLWAWRFIRDRIALLRVSRPLARSWILAIAVLGGIVAIVGRSSTGPSPHQTTTSAGWQVAELLQKRPNATAADNWENLDLPAQSVKQAELNAQLRQPAADEWIEIDLNPQADMPDPWAAVGPPIDLRTLEQRVAADKKRRWPRVEIGEAVDLRTLIQEQDLRTLIQGQAEFRAQMHPGPTKLVVGEPLKQLNREHADLPSIRPDVVPVGEPIELRTKAGNRRGERLQTGSTASTAAASKLPYGNYIRPLRAPNGQPWPQAAAYINGYAQLHTNGYSKVIIDNKGNTSDVFVKLVSLDSGAPVSVRTFFVPSRGTFTLETIRAGNYDVRYRDLDSGALLRSEPFRLEETNLESGVAYSAVTMTLYKVQGGNMKTYALSENEF